MHQLQKIQESFTLLFLLPQTRGSTEEKHKTDNDYEFIQRSKIRTMHFQASLPRLPIPKLEDTCRRYLNAQKPLLSEEEFTKTKSFVNQFLENEGLIFQNELIKKDKKNRHTSYISEYWFDMYLRDRRPLPINYNPIIIYTQESDERYNDQLVKATNFIVSSARFMKSLRAGILEPEVFHLNPKKSNTELFRTIISMLPSWISCYGAYAFKAFPLDMSQYENLFNSTRIPEFGKDRIFLEKSARHILVMRGGNFYCFDVINPDGTLVSPVEIAANLNFILGDNKGSSKNPIGIFTTSERDQWAKARAHLLKIGNNDVLQKIDSAAFALILDDEDFSQEFMNLLRNFLHGDGKNRWFDKSFSLIITKDGSAAVNFEHSWGDGIAILRYFQDVKTDISKHWWFQPEDKLLISKIKPDVESLEFTVDEKVKDMIEFEVKKYKELTDSLSVDYIKYDEFGKELIKQFGASPDAIIQLAIQLAFYKQEGRTAASYESCSTAAFKHGRTDTVRPCTEQTKKVCSILAEKSSEVSNAELKKMIVDCSKAHTELVKNAAMGQGFDRHLFALKKMQEELGSSKSPLFEDPAFSSLNYNILCTSTLSTPAMLGGGFGPVVPEGFGIGYMMLNKEIRGLITSYSEHKNAKEFVKNLTAALEDIRKVVISP
ncbi:carnitine O-palmitoyltransferase 2, mitochondrial-like isoform X2 [Leptopilina heterotoma]|uniref:carnitine O-palmitoyltransferase 2, mitochondrial-like isoform X2 n=1 Tax=Leptopilina heterotoma TaxID=63436 RepID=UPI001CA88751|nr:carnitine O-palmitoyltransferase 2, mitochondrial-like isoform X2 [Leptopilina heterotoma]